MSRLRGKLLLSMLAIVIVTVALSAVFTGRVTHQELRRILIAQRTKTDVGPDITALERHYRLHGSWAGVQPALDAMRQRVVLTTRARAIVATSSNLRGTRVHVAANDEVTTRSSVAMRAKCSRARLVISSRMAGWSSLRRSRGSFT